MKKTKTNVYDTASELYNHLLDNCYDLDFDKQYDLSDAKRMKIDPKYDSANITVDKYDSSECNRDKKKLMIQQH